MENVELVLTDLYPNPRVQKQFNRSKEDKIGYSEVPVDATNLTNAPKGLLTLVNSFHDMPPKDAPSILETAQKNGQPLLVYEMAENKMPLLIRWLLLPVSLLILMIMVLFMTPFVKPLTWRQLVFTYLIPVIPTCYAWDGQASLPRMYSQKDVDLLLDGLGSENYVRAKGIAKKKNGKELGTYIIGLSIS